MKKLILIILVIITERSGFARVDVSEKAITCHIGAVTKNNLPLGDFHYQDTITFNFNSIEEAKFKVPGGIIQTVRYGSGIAQFRGHIQMWNLNKIIVTKPVEIKFEIKRLGEFQKTGKLFITMYNVFTNSFETIERTMGTRHVSTHFVYEQEVFTGPSSNVLKSGDLMQSFIICSFDGVGAD